LEPKQRIWAAVAFAPVIFSPPVMFFLMEFRPDAVANAFLFVGLAVIALRDQKTFWIMALSGFCIGTAVLVNTKYILFPFILGTLAFAFYGWRSASFRRAALAVVAGFAASLLVAYFLLTLTGASLSDAWRMVVTYNSMSKATITLQTGLASMLVTKDLIWTAYGLAGLGGCIIFWIRRRQIPDVFSIAILIFLIVDLLTVARPWKQYTASWLLLCGWYPAYVIPILLARWRHPGQLVFGTIFSASAIISLVYLGDIEPNYAGISRDDQNRTADWILQNVPTNGYVVSSYHLHPVFRQDTFFKTVFDVTGNGDGLEEIMPKISSPTYAEHFQESGYWKDLQNRPPSILIPQEFSPIQHSVITNYAVQNNDAFEEIKFTNSKIFILHRKSNASQ
jgi:hypothetical protein